MSYAGGSEDDRILENFPPDYVGWAVELGAHDGTHKSNTRLLEDRGWTVLCIEPNPRFRVQLSRTRKLWLFCACDREPKTKTPFYENPIVTAFTQGQIREGYNWPASEVTVLTLDQCLMLVGFEKLDVLSLDVDGIEMDILAGFDMERWRPQVCVVENNAGRGSEIDQYFGGFGFAGFGPYSDNNMLYSKRWEPGG